MRTQTANKKRKHCLIPVNVKGMCVCVYFCVRVCVCVAHVVERGRCAECEGGGGELSLSSPSSPPSSSVVRSPSVHELSSHGHRLGKAPVRKPLKSHAHKDTKGGTREGRKRKLTHAPTAMHARTCRVLALYQERGTMTHDPYHSLNAEKRI